ncbi:MAG TPA: methyltransferase domain-containing protein [Syntrophorhabdaceae bacterium]|jgi:ubiquinone/menaquinone biosynthesis C-methylase UbiE
MEARQDISPHHLAKVKNFHDLDAPQYERLRYCPDTCEGLAYVTRKDLVLASLDQSSGRILDIGCGPGILTKDLIRRNLKVFSADLSMEMIKHAREQVKAESGRDNAHFVASDVSGLCFSDGMIDNVLCIGVVCYVTDYTMLLSEIYRVLKPGGFAVIQINNIRWPGIYRKFVPVYRYLKSRLTGKKYDGLTFDFNLFSRPAFLQDLKKGGFQITGLSHYDFRVPFADILLPKMSVKLSSFMHERRTLRFLRHFAHGLLITCRKVECS